MLLNELIFLMALESAPAVLTGVVWLSWSFYRLKKMPLQLFPWVKLSNELQKGKRKDVHWPRITHEAHYVHPFVLSSQEEQCYSTLQMGKPRLKEGQLNDSQACTLHLCSRRAATGPPPHDKSLQKWWDAKQVNLQSNSTGAFVKKHPQLSWLRSRKFAEELTQIERPPKIHSLPKVPILCLLITWGWSLCPALSPL